MKNKIDNIYQEANEYLFKILNTKYGKKVFLNECSYINNKNYKDINQFINHMCKYYDKLTVFICLNKILVYLDKEIANRLVYHMSRKQITDSKINKFKLLKKSYYYNKSYNKRKFNKLSNYRTRRREHRRKLMDSIGSDAYNGVDLFEGTEALATREAKDGSVDLGNPTDSGVDISSLVGGASHIWKAIK